MTYKKYKVKDIYESIKDNAFGISNELRNTFKGNEEYEMTEVEFKDFIHKTFKESDDDFSEEWINKVINDVIKNSVFYTN